MLEENIQRELIQKGRDFMKGYRKDDPYEELFESDQDLKRPQPPLCKAAVTPRKEHISLTLEFDQAVVKRDIFEVIRDRRSARIYTQENMTLEQLSFLLWSTQGIKDIRGKSYATLRTVPCGGARHEFETYLMIRQIEGLRLGIYHYLPMEHSLEFIKEVDQLEEKLNASLCGQSWSKKANVCFYWSMVAYRAEWRYGIYAHRVALMDVGHLCQNLYLACTALGLGTCGVGAFEHELCNELFDLDGNEEYVVYAAPVGTIREQDKAEEKAIYKFVEEQGL